MWSTQPGCVYSKYFLHASWKPIGQEFVNEQVKKNVNEREKESESESERMWNFVKCSLLGTCDFERGWEFLEFDSFQNRIGLNVKISLECANDETDIREHHLNITKTPIRHIHHFQSFQKWQKIYITLRENERTNEWMIEFQEWMRFLSGHWMCNMMKV
jgi:hypothetical protein